MVKDHSDSERGNPLSPHGLLFLINSKFFYMHDIVVAFDLTYKDDFIFIGRKDMFYLTTHSTHFIYGYMASDKATETNKVTHLILK